MTEVTDELLEEIVQVADAATQGDYPETGMEHAARLDPHTARAMAIQLQVWRKTGGARKLPIDGTRVRHTKSGGDYVRVGRVTIQADEPVTDMDELVLYVGRDGRLWARPLFEFTQRFTVTQPTDTEETAQ